MKVIKQMMLSLDEVKALAIEAIKKVAAETIGTPDENEEMIVDYSAYGTTTVEITSKDVDKTTQAQEATCPAENF